MARGGTDIPPSAGIGPSDACSAAVPKTNTDESSADTNDKCTPHHFHVTHHTGTVPQCPRDQGGGEDPRGAAEGGGGQIMRRGPFGLLDSGMNDRTFCHNDE